MTRGATKRKRSATKRNRQWLQRHRDKNAVATKLEQLQRLCDDPFDAIPSSQYPNVQIKALSPLSTGVTPHDLSFNVVLICVCHLCLISPRCRAGSKS